MIKKSKKRKFSNNQLVVFRFGDRKLVGNIVFMRPVGKQFIYDVECEDGKTYYELPVDAPINSSIDTYLTRLFYQKYKIDENAIPELDDDGPILSAPKIIDSVDVDTVIEEESDYIFDEEDAALFADEDSNPDY